MKIIGKKNIIMKTTNCLERMTALAVAGLVAGAMSARATIDMSITDPGSLSVTDVGLTSPDGKNLGVGGYYIGVYGFTVSAIDDTTAAATGLTVNSKFNSVCLSPSGELYANTTYNYTYESFSGAAKGLNPKGYWSDYGIESAAWLWNKESSGVTTGAQGAGLALAMLEVLYNAGANGTIIANPTAYAPNFGNDEAARTAYNAYLADFSAAGSSVTSLASYGIFVPTTGSSPLSGQEFIFLSPNDPNIQPVPEPTTLISGALLLLPFGASTLRILRKKNMPA
jgi:hypothetical protein